MPALDQDRIVFQSAASTGIYAVSTNLTSWPVIKAPSGDINRGSAKGIRVTVCTDADLSSNNQYINVCLIDADGSTVLQNLRATCTASIITGSTTMRTGLAGNSGNYLANVVFDETGTSIVDLVGHGCGSESAANKSVWKIGVPALAAGIATVSIDIAYLFNAP